MSEPPPLNPGQAKTIGRVQHGMLFQHVLAARLVAQELISPGFFDRLVVERDEDIEMVRGGVRLYVQAKAYTELVFSELKDAIAWLHKIRLEHLSLARHGQCRLFLAIGGTLGPELAGRGGASKVVLERKVRELADDSGLDSESLVETWREIEWLTPGSSHEMFGKICFRATVSESLADLTADLARIARLANSPAAAAYALSTAMHALAADSLVGFSNRSVVPASIANLIETVEQRVRVTQDLPTPYVPLPTNAAIFVEGATRVVLASTGSGKSAHIAYEALKSGLSVICLYPAESGISGLRDCALQLRRHLIGVGVPAAELIPANADVPLVEMLALLCASLPADVYVVIDDVHLLSDNAASRALLRGASRRTTGGLVLAGLPQQEGGVSTCATLATILGRPPEIVDLPGWSTANLSELLFLKGMPQEPVIVSDLRGISGGHPFAVQALIDLATREFGGNIEKSIEALRRGSVESTIDAVASAHLASLPASARRAACAFAISKVIPGLATLEKLLPSDEARAGFSQLVAHRCLLRTPNGYRLHDLYHHAGALAAPDVFSRDERNLIHANAAAVLEAELQRTRLVDLVPGWLLNRGLSGDMSGVVEVLTNGGDLWVEALQRMGVGTPVARVVEQLLPLAKAEDRFWLIDSLIFLNYSEELRLDVDELWESYKASFDLLDDPDAEQGAFLSKAMRRAVDKGNAVELGALWVQVQSISDSPRRKAIINNEYASCLYALGQHETAWSIAIANIRLYMLLLESEERDLWMLPPADLARAVSRGDRADVSRLADTLLLLGMCLRELGEWPVEVFARSRFLYGLVGGRKASDKAELHMARQLGRKKSTRPVAVQLMEERLKECKRTSYEDGVVVVTCTLAVLCEIAGDVDRAAGLLAGLAHCDPRQVADEIADARAQITPFAAESPGPRTEGMLRRRE